MERVRIGASTLGFRVAHIEPLDNEALLTRLEAHRAVLNKCRLTSTFQFTPTPGTGQDQVLGELKALFHSAVTPGATTANTLYCFHGCSARDVESITLTGLANFAKLDSGYFGSGVYVTPNAEYAARYACGDFSPDPSTAPQPHKDHPTWHAVLLCSVAVGLAYPVTRTVDYAGGRTTCALRGQPIRAPFDATITPVHSRFQFECCDAVLAEYMELCVSQNAAVLPLAVLWVERC
jgi:hypothetical protein